MSQHVRAAPWAHRSALYLIAAPVARLLRRPRPERALPHDWREIERARLELELKKAQIALHARFKVM
jgi:hypothetical protein